MRKNESRSRAEAINPFDAWMKKNMQIPTISDGEQAFNYGGYKFISAGKFDRRKFHTLANLRLRSHTELKLWDGYFAMAFNEEPSTQYNHEAFYEAMNNSEDDIFLCVEDLKFYVPCEHELMVFEGYN